MEKTKRDKIHGLTKEVYKNYFSIGMYQTENKENAVEACLIGEHDELLCAISSVACDENNRETATAIKELLLQSTGWILGECDNDTFDKFETMFRIVKENRQKTTVSVPEYTVTGNVIKATFGPVNKNRK